MFEPITIEIDDVFIRFCLIINCLSYYFDIKCKNSICFRFSYGLVLKNKYGGETKNRTENHAIFYFKNSL